MKNKKINFKLLSIVVLIYLLVNLLFNINIWKDIIRPSSENILVQQGESPTYEYIAESVKQNIIKGNNPFKPINNIPYPFSWDFVIDDMAPINGFYFLFLRPFFTIHQSMMLIVVFGILLSNLSMFFLLKYLKINSFIAFIFGLIYGFTPFVSLRLIGHPTYTALYIFPILILFFLLMTDLKINNKKRILYAILLGISFWMTVLTNLYFVIMIIIFILLILVFKLFNNWKNVMKFISIQKKYLIIFIISSFIFLLPWFSKTIEFLLIEPLSKPVELINYSQLSGDFLNIFIPSRLNPLYNEFLNEISKYLSYISEIFEDFIYPGLILIICYIIFGINYKKFNKNIRDYFWISIIFLVFSLGPYLRIAGIITNIPLPYIFFYNIPIFNLARAPGRFIVVFIFLGCLISAFVVQHLVNKKILKKNIIYVILIAIFFIDQFYINLDSVKRPIPIHILKYINRQSKGVTLNIPFTIRDGINFLGHKHLIWLPNWQFIHNQPGFDIYAGRINEEIFDFYKKDYLFNTLNSLINNKKAPSFLNEQKISKSISYFNIKNIILNKKYSYSKKIENVLINLQFKKIIEDGNYILYSKNL
jgi:hypothetical protein